MAGAGRCGRLFDRPLKRLSLRAASSLAVIVGALAFAPGAWATVPPFLPSYAGTVFNETYGNLEQPAQARAMPESTPSSAATADEHAQAGGPIYFWANLGAAVSPPDKFLPNPFVVRPPTFVIFEDGSFQIEKLNWTGWGSSVARATGKSNSDDDKPNVAEGKHTITWAKVRLYNPGVFHGKRIYRCIRIEAPSPAHVGPSCLQRTVGGVALLPPGSGPPVGLPGESSNARLTQFVSPDRHVSCYIGGSPSGASCYAYLSRRRHITYKASLDGSGKVSLCSSASPESPVCFEKWIRGLPVLHYGQWTEAGSMRCRSSNAGITCIKVSGVGKGHGFRVSKEEAVEVEA
jgi:hypothetical protein